MATTVILPAALRYQTELATNVASLKALGIDADTGTLDEVTAAITALRAGIAALRAAAGPRRRVDDRGGGGPRRPRCCRRWPTVRTAADALEALVADDLWPLPTYQEMLFIL